ncbi:zinc finger HIT domain-containing protein 3 [Cimex lectularius]|uniref:HIT-type domain-containing protein n=1 Tax=Cimex lectularius TaxID=79782 RepID=A0A8I6RJK1_CIMLE|nr:zinc finger HIT domain-containing protein 3 [Cimex lectularius]
MKICIVCSKEDSLYKCPKCLSPYCTSCCFKKHKSDGCEEAKKIVCPEPPRKKYKHFTEDTVPIEKLELLKTNKKLLEILENHHLRRIMEDIDNARSTEDSKRLIQDAMVEPIFVEFADECLRVVEDV